MRALHGGIQRMKLAILADIHGNIDALDAALDDARTQQVDGYLFLGDYIFDMPFSTDVVRRLRELPHARIIKGNKEGYLDDLARQSQDGWTAQRLAVIYQTYRELNASDRTWLSALPAQLTFTLPSGRSIYAVHAIELPAPRMRNEFNSSGEFAQSLDGRAACGDDYDLRMTGYLGAHAAECCARAGADIVAFGHTHLQGCGGACGRMLVNPGACGQPMDGIAGAPYAILHDGPELRIERRRVQYNIDRAIERARTTSISRAGRIWSELVWRSLRSGRDNFTLQFDIARALAAERGQTDGLNQNDTWRDAYERFKAMYGAD